MNNQELRHLTRLDSGRMSFELSYAYSLSVLQNYPSIFQRKDSHLKNW